MTAERGTVAGGRRDRAPVGRPATPAVSPAEVPTSRATDEPATGATGNATARAGVAAGGIAPSRTAFGAKRLAAIVCLVALAITLHALQIAGIRQVSHDDTISFLAATGHQGQYARIVESGQAPVAQWVPAERWKAMTRIERPVPFATIARDLGNHDIHPPVYFWLLHVWSLVVGVGLWTGPLLNVVLHLLTAVALWRLARRLLGSPVAAWGVAGVWAALPAVAETAQSSRQYSLGALLAVLAVSAWLRVRDGDTSARTGLALVLWTAAGMLTQYTFGVVVVGMGLVAATDLVRPSLRRRAVRTLAAFALAGVVFVAGQPRLAEMLARQRDQAEPFSTFLLQWRIGRLIEGLPSFAAAGMPTAVGIAVLLATCALWVVAWRARPAARPVLWLTAWIAGALVVSFLTATSPGAAWQARYFALALPFAAFIPVAAWRALRRLTWPASPAVVGIAVYGVVAVLNIGVGVVHARQPAIDTLDGDRPAVLDNLARGVLLRILWDAPDDVPVYAADQTTLLATTDRWLTCEAAPVCAGRPLTLVSQVQYEATREGQAAVLDAVRLTRRVAPQPPISTVAERYRLSEPTGAAAVGSSP